MIVDIYASGTDCIIESKEYTGKALTVADLLAECAPDMKKDLPLAFELDGAPADRHSTLRGHARLAIRLQPCYGWEFVIALIILAIAAAVYATVMMERMKKKQGASNKNKGSSIYDPNVQANQAKLLSPIPQQFGYMKRFPDYLNERHSFYLNNKKYETLLLSLGIGWFDISGTYIGNIPRESLAGKSFVRYYDPGEKIRDLIITGSGTTAYSMYTENGKLVVRDEVTGLQTEDEDYAYNLAPYKNWYNSPDVQGIQLNAKKSPLSPDEDNTTVTGAGSFEFGTPSYYDNTFLLMDSKYPGPDAGPHKDLLGWIHTTGWDSGDLFVIKGAPLACNSFNYTYGHGDLFPCLKAKGDYDYDIAAPAKKAFALTITFYEHDNGTEYTKWELNWNSGYFFISKTSVSSDSAPENSVDKCVIPYRITCPTVLVTKAEFYQNGDGTDFPVHAIGTAYDEQSSTKYFKFEISFTVHSSKTATYEELSDFGKVESNKMHFLTIPYHKHGYAFKNLSVTKTEGNGFSENDLGSESIFNYIDCWSSLPYGQGPLLDHVVGQHIEYPSLDPVNVDSRVIRYWADLNGVVLKAQTSMSAHDGKYSRRIKFTLADPRFTYVTYQGYLIDYFPLGFTDFEYFHSYEVSPTGIIKLNTDTLDGGSSTVAVPPSLVPSVSFKLRRKQKEDSEDYKGYTPYAYRPQPIGKPITHFQVSINFPGGLYHMNNNGSYGKENVTIYIAYRTIGSADWTVDTRAVSGSNTNELGFTYEYDVPEGEYEVKVGLQGSEDSQANNQGSWENLAGIIGEKQVYEGMTTVFCCVQSSNIFSGMNNNQISSFCARQRNNSGTRVEMSTIEDAAIYLVQSSKYFSMPARLDYAAFKDAQAKYWSGIAVNGVFDEKSTFWDCLQDILKIGFAEPIVRGNVISVAVDRSHKDEAFRYVFHADNIIGDVSVSYSYPTATTIIEYEVQYTDPDTWKQAVVYVAYVPKDSYDMTGEEQDRFFLSESEYRLLKADDTYANYLGSGHKVRGGERSEGRIYESDSAMTESPQTFELWGVTDRDRAILIAVRALRRQIYITRNFSFSVDLSALNVQYLDYVGIFVPYSTAGVSGIIRGVARTDGSYTYLNVKTNSGRSLDHSDAYTQEADGTARKLSVTPQRNAESYREQPNPDTWEVTGANSVTADDAGMPIVCGKAIPCLVQSVTPDAEKAKIELSEYSEEIYSEVKVYTRRGDTFDFSYYGDPSRTIA